MEEGGHQGVPAGVQLVAVDADVEFEPGGVGVVGRLPCREDRLGFTAADPAARQPPPPQQQGQRLVGTLAPSLGTQIHTSLWENAGWRQNKPGPPPTSSGGRGGGSSGMEQTAGCGQQRSDQPLFSLISSSHRLWKVCYVLLTVTLLISSHLIRGLVARGQK